MFVRYSLLCNFRGVHLQKKTPNLITINCVQLTAGIFNPYTTDSKIFRSLNVL